VQAQVLLLLKELQQRRGLAFVFVSHDLGVIRWFCSRVAVMYLGRIVEQGPVKQVFAAPRHPYTRMLRDASPIPDPAQRGVLPRVVGEIPSAASPTQTGPIRMATASPAIIRWKKSRTDQTAIWSRSLRACSGL
jgi:oligopeptide/dipeptide ABC transporter ATP-binding protein